MGIFDFLFGKSKEELDKKSEIKESEIKETNRQLEKNETNRQLEKNEIESLRNLIKIEIDLKKKFDEDFYYNTNLENYDENVNLILNSIKKKELIELYKECEIFDKKIKFGKFLQIFNTDDYIIKLPFLINWTGFYSWDYLSCLFGDEIKKSINDNFILKLNKTLESKEKPREEVFQRISRSGKRQNLGLLIRNYLFENSLVEKNILNFDNTTINQLNKTYNEYKDLNSRFVLYKNLNHEKETDKWNYKFYDDENKPTEDRIISTGQVFERDNENYVVSGLEVFNKIVSIIVSSIYENNRETKDLKSNETIVKQSKKEENKDEGSIIINCFGWNNSEIRKNEVPYIDIEISSDQLKRLRDMIDYDLDDLIEDWNERDDGLKPLEVNSWILGELLDDDFICVERLSYENSESDNPICITKIDIEYNKKGEDVYSDIYYMNRNTGQKFNKEEILKMFNISKINDIDWSNENYGGFDYYLIQNFILEDVLENSFE